MYSSEMELIVDGRGGISSADDQHNDPFEHVAHLEALLGHPLCVVEEVTVTTTVTTTRRTLTLKEFRMKPTG